MQAKASLLKDICPADILVLLNVTPFPAPFDWLHRIVLRRFAELVKPRDGIEWIRVKDAADAHCEAQWLQKLKFQAANRPLKDHIAARGGALSDACEAKISKLREQRDGELLNKTSQLRGTPEYVKAETARLEAEMQAELAAEIDKIELETFKEITKLESVCEEEMTAADFVEQWMGWYEKIDERIQIAERRFNDALAHLDQYRHGGLGERLRKAAVIEGECEEVFELGPRTAQQAEATASPLRRPPPDRSRKSRDAKAKTGEVTTIDSYCSETAQPVQRDESPDK
jgi:hypothetical protein